MLENWACRARLLRNLMTILSQSAFVDPFQAAEHPKPLTCLPVYQSRHVLDIISMGPFQSVDKAYLDLDADY